MRGISHRRSSQLAAVKKLGARNCGGGRLGWSGAFRPFATGHLRCQRITPVDSERSGRRVISPNRVRFERDVCVGPATSCGFPRALSTSHTRVAAIDGPALGRSRLRPNPGQYRISHIPGVARARRRARSGQAGRENTPYFGRGMGPRRGPVGGHRSVILKIGRRVRPVGPKNTGAVRQQ